MDVELYAGDVMHARLAAPRYRFGYRVFSLLVDIDRLSRADKRLKVFSYKRFNLISFHDRDHLPAGSEETLREWIEARLTERGIDIEGGRVRLLCFPRVLGFVFNPLSVWFCEHRDGRLRAIVCEVRNTFGERHCYLLHDPDCGPMDWKDVREHPKRFHVSPFLPIEGGYRFHFSQPLDTLDISILWRAQGERQFVATQRLRRKALTDAALLGCALAMPFMTFKVVFAIHWQALKIWLRGGRFHRKPAPPTEEVSPDVR